MTLPPISPYTPDLVGAAQLPRPRTVHLTAYVAGTTRRVTVRDSVAGVTRTTPATFASSLWEVPSGLSGRMDLIQQSQTNPGTAASPYIFNDASSPGRGLNNAANVSIASYPALAVSTFGRVGIDSDLGQALQPLNAGDQIAVNNPGSPVDGWTTHCLMSFWPSDRVAFARVANIASATPTIVYTCPAGKIATLMSAGYGRHEGACRYAAVGAGTPFLRYWLLESGETTASVSDDRLLHATPSAADNSSAAYLPFPVRLTPGQSLVFQRTNGTATNAVRALFALEDA
jgi:hypothetical protein